MWVMVTASAAAEQVLVQVSVLLVSESRSNLVAAHEPNEHETAYSTEVETRVESFDGLQQYILIDKLSLSVNNC